MSAHTLPANLSFWLVEAEKEVELPSAEQLLQWSYADFLTLYVKEGRKYGVFLSHAFNSRSTYAIPVHHSVTAVNHLTAAYSRVYSLLKGNRNKVIKAFTEAATFDIAAARSLLDECELRSPRARPPRYPDTEIYERLALCANRFSVLDCDISGADLISLRDGVAPMPLCTSNMAKAAVFLDLVAAQGLLPHNWKKRVATGRLLYNSRTCTYPSAAYLRNVVSEYRTHNFFPEIAAGVKRVFAEHANNV